MTVRHSIQLIGYQIQDQALWQNNYNMLIIESVGAFLDVLIGYFLNSSALRWRSPTGAQTICSKSEGFVWEYSREYY